MLGYYSPQPIIKRSPGCYGFPGFGKRIHHPMISLPIHQLKQHQARWQGLDAEKQATPTLNPQSIELGRQYVLKKGRRVDQRLQDDTVQRNLKFQYSEFLITQSLKKQGYTFRPNISASQKRPRIIFPAPSPQKHSAPNYYEKLMDILRSAPDRNAHQNINLIMNSGASREQKIGALQTLLAIYSQVPQYSDANLTQTYIDRLKK